MVENLTLPAFRYLLFLGQTHILKYSWEGNDPPAPYSLGLSLERVPQNLMDYCIIIVPLKLPFWVGHSPFSDMPKYPIVGLYPNTPP